MKNLLLITLTLFLLGKNISFSQFSFTSIGTVYNQDFESFDGTPGTIPLHWTNSFNDYDPGGYYSNADPYKNNLSTYALNQNGSGEYAIGSKIAAQGGIMSLELSCINNIPGTTITSFTVLWDVEQYSEGGRETEVELLNSLGGTINGDNLVAATTAPTNGNINPVDVTSRSITYTGLSIANGSTFEFIWQIRTGANSGDNAHMGIDGIVISVESFLPVELEYFDVQIEGQCSKLNWATFSELNNDHFIIEKSQNGFEFFEIGRVEGNGTSYERRQYSFIDKNPFFGNNYYRLNQVDFDGKKNTSKVITLNYNHEIKVAQIYPTNFNSGFWIKLNKEIEHGIIFIFDTTGRILFEKNIYLEKLIHIDMTGHNEGIYFVTMNLDNNIFTEKIFKY